MSGFEELRRDLRVAAYWRAKEAAVWLWFIAWGCTIGGALAWAFWPEWAEGPGLILLALFVWVPFALSAAYTARTRRRALPSDALIQPKEERRHVHRVR